MTRLPETRLALAALTAAALLAGHPGLARAQDEMLILRRGDDTVAVERFRRTATRFDAELLYKMGGARFTFVIITGADGRVLQMENEYRRAGAPAQSKPLQRATMFFRSDSLFKTDSVLVEISDSAGRQRTQRLGTERGALPYLNPSFAVLELAVARLRAQRTDSITTPFFFVSGGVTLQCGIKALGPDSVKVTFTPGQDAFLAVDRAGRITGGTVPSQNLRLSRGPADSAALFVPKPDYSAPTGAPYSAQEIRVPTPMGHTLAGTLTVPAGPGPFPVVVTITGSGLQDRDQAIPIVKGYRPFRQIADALGREGIAVLRMDDRGFGDSGGEASAATTEDFAKDIQAALNWVKGRKDLDARRLGLVGHSEGGMIAPIVGAADPGLRGIVLMAGPARTGRAILDYQNRYAIEHSAQIRAEARDSAMEVTHRMVDSIAQRNAWVRFFLDYDPKVTARRVKVPTLILQGATDRQVTADQAEELAAAFRQGGNKDVTVRVFADLNHLFLQDTSGNPAGYPDLKTGEIRADVVGALTDWLVNKLAAPTQAKTPPRNPDLLTGAEIQARPELRTAYDAVQTLRPAFLRIRPTGSIVNQAPVQVYVDGVRRGGVATLVGIPAIAVSEMRYLKGTDATTRYGIGHENGAIVVTTGRSVPPGSP